MKCFSCDEAGVIDLESPDNASRPALPAIGVDSLRSVLSTTKHSLPTPRWPANLNQQRNAVCPSSHQAAPHQQVRDHHLLRPKQPPKPKARLSKTPPKPPLQHQHPNRQTANPHPPPSVYAPNPRPSLHLPPTELPTQTPRHPTAVARGHSPKNRITYSRRSSRITRQRMSPRAILRSRRNCLLDSCITISRTRRPRSRRMPMRLLPSMSMSS